LRNPFKLDAYQPQYGFDDYVLYFGRLDPEKGVLTLVKAMEQLPKLRLVVVGDGAQLPELVAWANEHNVYNVEFVGPKWGADLEPILARARCVVVPSEWYEPSPMVIYQSLATGKPVVGARIGGIPDLLTTETGVLFTPGDVDDLAAKLDAINSDENTLRAMGRQARRWAEENLNPAGFYRQLMSIYDDVREGNT
jgi:glycosyltransferase involved in cell wall biosynthesis